MVSMSCCSWPGAPDREAGDGAAAGRGEAWQAESESRTASAAQTFTPAWRG
jgi:hypothetical protein